MPTLMPTDTRAILGDNAEHCESRSLLLDRFVYEHAAMAEARKLHLAQVCPGSFHSIHRIRQAWETRLRDAKAKEKGNAKAFLADTAGMARRRQAAGPYDPDKILGARKAFVAKLTEGEILFVQLQSRLMVNMASGVVENAGLCLDRFGLPQVPGSAVKASARRMALVALREWCELGKKPIDGGNPCADVSKDYASPAGLLADIAIIFGWSQDDWDKPKTSDFAWAAAKQWADVRSQARAQLMDAFQALAPPDDFAGAASFMPGYPCQLPANDLELDVLTCHHPDYYSQKKADQGQTIMPVALDSEQRILPVVFPAVAQGVTFQFIVLPLRGLRCSLSQSGKKLHSIARDWLHAGLETFGLGAKTASGYGWFKQVTQPRMSTSTSPQKKAVAAASPSPTVDTHSEHRVITQWRGRTQPENFRAFRQQLASIADVDELRRVFQAIIPEAELRNLTLRNRYWQSFRSHPQGQAILQRLGITIR